MTPANQHTGIERLSDERLSTVVSCAAVGQPGVEPHEVEAMARELLSLRASAGDEQSVTRLLSLISDIREASGVGTKPMLSDLPEAIRTKVCASAEPQKPVAWMCDGCGWLFKDPAGDMHALRVSGALSCCPERKPIPLYTHSHSSSAVDGVTVKPLEWTECGTYEVNGLRVPPRHGVAVAYSESSSLGTYGVVKGTQDRYEAWLNHNQVSGSFLSSKEAMDAAQADYETRILSALAGGSNGRS